MIDINTLCELVSKTNYIGMKIIISFRGTYQYIYIYLSNNVT